MILENGEGGHGARPHGFIFRRGYLSAVGTFSVPAMIRFL